MNKSGFVSVALHFETSTLFEKTRSYQLSSGNILIFKAKAVSASLVEHNVTWKTLKTDLVLRP